MTLKTKNLTNSTFLNGIILYIYLLFHNFSKVSVHCNFMENSIQLNFKKSSFFCLQRKRSHSVLEWHFIFNGSFKTVQVWKAYCKCSFFEYWQPNAVCFSCHLSSVSVWRLTGRTLSTVDYFVLLLMSVTQASLTKLASDCRTFRRLVTNGFFFPSARWLNAPYRDLSIFQIENERTETRNNYKWQNRKRKHEASGLWGKYFHCIDQETHRL